MNSNRISARPSIRRHPSDFVSLKSNVRRKLMHEFGDAVPIALIRRAVDEAELTAEASGFPQLFFPVLAAEQVERVSRLMLPATAEGGSRRLFSAA